VRELTKTQGTNEWFQARLDKVSASNIAKAMHFVSKGSVKRKDKRLVSAADREAYIRSLAWAMIKRVPDDNYVSDRMDLGTQYEPAARRALSTRLYGNPGEIEQTGFVLHPELDWLGCSPDGYVIEEGRIIPVELKVPFIVTHEKYVDENVVPEEYRPQCELQALCCDRAPYYYFASYCPPQPYPEMPDEYRLFWKKQPSNPELWPLMEEGATSAIEAAVLRANEIRERYKDVPKSKLRRDLEASINALDGTGLEEADFDAPCFQPPTN
jgi:hypothetical protein